MKLIITICLVLLYTCSCCETNYIKIEENPQEKRLDEIRRIMRAYDINEFEKSDNLTVEQRRDLERMKHDYYAVSNDPFLICNITSPDWYISGPYVIDELNEEFRNIPQEGDEGYDYRSDFLSFLYGNWEFGFVIIRDNKVIYKEVYDW